VEQRERELATQVVIAEQGRWYTALPRPLFAFAFVIYVWMSDISAYETDLAA